MEFNKTLCNVCNVFTIIFESYHIILFHSISYQFIVHTHHDENMPGMCQGHFILLYSYTKREKECVWNVSGIRIQGLAGSYLIFCVNSQLWHPIYRNGFQFILREKTDLNLFYGKKTDFNLFYGKETDFNLFYGITETVSNFRPYYFCATQNNSAIASTFWGK